VVEKAKYKRNFIIEALIRIDFNGPINLTSPILKKFKKNLKIENIEFEEKTVKKVDLRLKEKNQIFSIENIGKAGVYNFDNGYSRFEIDFEKFFLLSNKYVSFSKFFDNFKKGFLTIQNLLNIKEFTRIGLRYINKIKFENIKSLKDWKKFINKDFIPNYSKIENVNNILKNFDLRRNFNLFVFSDGEFFVNINLGIWNDNFPGKIMNNEFILDIDCYIDNVILNDEDILKKPERMNRIAFKYFDLITTQELKIKLEEE